MSAQPVHQPDPEDPVEIRRVLPERYHALFLREYTAAWEQARRPEGFGELHELLRLWRLRAIAYSDPGYERSAQAARDAAPEDLIPIPGWDYRR